MFADTELASRIESVEAGLTREAARSFCAHESKHDAFALDIDQGIAVFLRPGSPMNKVIGVFSSVPSNDVLAHIENQYRARAEPVRMEISTLANPDIGKTLTERGYRLLGFENVLGQALRAGESRPVNDISVEQVAGAEIADWSRVIVDGFAQPDDTGVVIDAYPREVIEQVMSDFLRIEGLTRYLARRDGILAGGASMRTDGNVALMTGAATLAEHRRHGAQGALLARRLRDAFSMGAKTAIITTSGGTRSQANAMRQGFSLLYSRAVLVLDTVPAEKTA